MPRTRARRSGARDCAKELGVVIIAPDLRKRGPGLYHNSAAVIDADGSLLGAYRKMHIPDDPLYYESSSSRRRTDAARRVEKHSARVRAPTGSKCADAVREPGVLICWDQWYPEARGSPLLGARSCSIRRRSGGSWATSTSSRGPPRAAHHPAHAMPTRLCGGANRTGSEPHPGTNGVRYWGSSFVATRWEHREGRRWTRGGAACVRAGRSRGARLWPFFRDRRIDAYGPITSADGRVRRRRQNQDEATHHRPEGAERRR